MLHRLRHSLLLLVTLGALYLPTARLAVAQSTGCFAETGFCLAEGSIASYFWRHGGVQVLGYPISRAFRLRGQQVQLFQRIGVRETADGSAAELPVTDLVALPSGGLADWLSGGDYVKSLLLGQEPLHLSVGDASTSRLYRQYNPWARDGLNRPWDLPNSDLRDAFRGVREPAALRLAASELSTASGWPIQNGPDARLGPTENGYMIGVEQGGGLDRGRTIAASNLLPLGDFLLVIDARLSEPGRAGYAFHLRQRSEQERFTLLVDAERGLSTFYRRAGGVETVLWDWSWIAAFRPGAEMNRFTIRAVGPRFTVWTNGGLLFDLEAAGPADGTLWLAAVTWDAPNAALFSEFNLLSPD